MDESQKLADAKKAYKLYQAKEAYKNYQADFNKQSAYDAYLKNFNATQKQAQKQVVDDALAIDTTPRTVDDSIGGYANAIIDGVSQGLSFGFGDEIAGLNSATTEYIESFANGKDYDFSESYNRNRDAIRDRVAYSDDNFPTTSFLSNLAGGMVTGGANLPKSAAKLAAYGAGMGGLAGTGYSNAEDFSGVAEDAFSGAIMGGALTPALVKGAPLAVRGAKKTVRGTEDLIHRIKSKKAAKQAQALQDDAIVAAGGTADDVAAATTPNIVRAKPSMATTILEGAEDLLTGGQHLDPTNLSKSLVKNTNQNIKDVAQGSARTLMNFTSGGLQSGTGVNRLYRTPAAGALASARKGLGVARSDARNALPHGKRIPQNPQNTQIQPDVYSNSTMHQILNGGPRLPTSQKQNIGPLQKLTDWARTDSAGNPYKTYDHPDFVVPRNLGYQIQFNPSVGRDINKQVGTQLRTEANAQQAARLATEAEYSLGMRNLRARVDDIHRDDALNVMSRGEIQPTNIKGLNPKQIEEFDMMQAQNLQANRMVDNLKYGDKADVAVDTMNNIDDMILAHKQLRIADKGTDKQNPQYNTVDEFLNSLKTRKRGKTPVDEYDDSAIRLDVEDSRYLESPEGQQKLNELLERFENLKKKSARINDILDKR